MTDLTKITTPFGLLDPETQEALKAHGGPYEVYFSVGWESVVSPFWAINCCYRVKPQPPTKPSIDWSDVVPEWRWLARDKNGHEWLYTEKPTCDRRYWTTQGEYRRADILASYRPGTCDWKDSLVERPE